MYIGMDDSKEINVLVLKDNYNSFEQYYLDKLNNKKCTAAFYYRSSTIIRKLFTHYGLPFESLWYGAWKYDLNKYDYIIVFDSLHSSNLLKYIRSNYMNKLIFWHWNPINKEKDKLILQETKEFCEHWTFNKEDAIKYEMKLNNQFFFFQEKTCVQKSESVFFVGTEKGRYENIMSIGKVLNTLGMDLDFHIITPNIKDKRKFVEYNFMQYTEVMRHIQKSKAMLEIVQTGQNGLTARSLEAMFFNTKLITNNIEIKNAEFYRENNIFIIGYDPEEKLGEFLNMPFQKISCEDLRSYDADGWLDKFINDN